MQKHQISKYKWIGASFVVSILLMGIKFFAFYLTDSNAILTDAVESIINVFASGFAFYSIYLAAQPKDANHPYGHGKIEYFSTGFEGALIMIAGFYILYETGRRYFAPMPVENLGYGFLLLSSTIVLNGALGLGLLDVGKKTNSVALEADGQHLLVDSLSSIFVLVGVGLIWLTGLVWIDTVVSLVVAAFILYNGFKLVRRSIAALMDEVDEAVVNSVVQIISHNKNEEWIDVHNLRVQRYGSDLHVDCHLTLPNYWDLSRVHESIHVFEETLEANTQGSLEIFIHADPCLPDCCKYCRVQNCPIRAQPFSQDIEWTSENLTKNQKHFVAQLSLGS